ncbi:MULTISPECIES: undecaprenyl-diphosphate phosphatase [Marivita]|uniref:Undecaprenyl-diphosphatase n=1 Tax=Marivita cryptomonadis TaxID=505252 RepID=A0A9Q2P9Y8_9RHOB|nr:MULTISPECIES: undecaprenyl-diphosphate phosphatase [Marivita]MCR9170425.1 undecaprenyl-diphosphate phosphatase [Paracoccaceae bacterium]MBM2321730.1 undecaprenyl-diphosphate phosphatase [Marivita cryptomonadis]MBM2331311.1 undecaprenyl-diphosphate phosphatase [Marivita cryptomonadis]MBM2340897.1 undecaprenyl-diphosphate phosphatase [Marivita cryptomonadis]MBM2345559.1 undecaprenyl-diphosphate phosphatase [Marivita cryptomonadis]
MPLTHLLILALIQGVTEFLPISSSGHLILLPNLTGMADQGQALDVAVHVGTLLAVILYFWSDVKIVTSGLGRLIKGRIDTQGAFWALCLIIATIPVILVGLALKLSGLNDLLRSTAVIGWTMLLFGIVLYWADQTGPIVKRAENWSLKDAIIMGLWQTLALIPGTSRSGITITAGRQLGYDRESATRLSMLMSIPTILASGVLLSVEAVQDADMSIVRDAAIAAIFAFLAALAALKLMFKLLKSVSFTPYVIYRVILGVILLIIAYT